MAGFVFAKKTMAIGGVVVRRGDAWDAEAELVKQRPWLFSDRPSRVMTGNSTRVQEVPEERLPQVEAATRAPGEVRATKKATKKAAPKSDGDG